jgi:PPOX class probable F420-dependent enzyme
METAFEWAGTQAATAVVSAVSRRRSATSVWIASVRPDGAPHLIPLWFAWDGDDLIVLSKPNAQKVRNLRRDPRVVLALGSVDHGMDVDLIEGLGEVLDAPSSAVIPATAFARYAGPMARLGLTLDVFFATYSQPIRIRLLRRLNWGQPGWV